MDMLARAISEQPRSAVRQLAVLQLLRPLVQLRDSCIDAALLKHTMVRRVLIEVASRYPRSCILRNAAADVINAVLQRTDEASLELQASLVPPDEPSVFVLLAGQASQRI